MTFSPAREKIVLSPIFQNVDIRTVHSILVLTLTMLYADIKSPPCSYSLPFCLYSFIISIHLTYLRFLLSLRDFDSTCL